MLLFAFLSLCLLFYLLNLLKKKVCLCRCLLIRSYILKVYGLSHHILVDFFLFITQWLTAILIWKKAFSIFSELLADSSNNTLCIALAMLIS